MITNLHVDLRFRPQRPHTLVVVRPRALVSPAPGMCAQLVQAPPPLAALLQRVKVKCSQPRQTLPSPAQPSQPSPAQPSPALVRSHATLPGHILRLETAIFSPVWPGVAVENVGTCSLHSGHYAAPIAQSLLLLSTGLLILRLWTWNVECSSHPPPQHWTVAVAACTPQRGHHSMTA